MRILAAENAKSTKDDYPGTIFKHLHDSTRSTRLKNYTPYASFAAKNSCRFCSRRERKEHKG
jgi:hypothetical protein